MTRTRLVELLGTLTRAERAKYYRLTSQLGRESALSDGQRLKLVQLVKMGRTVIERKDVT